MPLNTPTLIPRPWACEGDRNPIPDTTEDFGHASWEKGFPAENALPISHGGTPPRYKDFQGVLNALSEHAVFAQSGAIYPWSNRLEYLCGSRVLGEDEREYVAILPSGPDSDGSINPVEDFRHEHWKLLSDHITEKTSKPLATQEWVIDLLTKLGIITSEKDDDWQSYDSTE